MKKSYLYGVVTILIWSTTAALVKALLFDIPNLQALSVSSLFAFLFLLAVNLKSGKLAAIRRCSGKELGMMSGLGFLGLFLYSALYYYGLANLSSQEACILNYLWPIMLVIFSCILLKEKLTAMKVVAMGCSFVGILILSLGNRGTGTGNAPVGMLCCIIAAACYGAFSVLNKKADLDQSLTMMISWLTAAVCGGILGFLTEEWVPIEGVQWLGILWLGIVVDAVAYLLWALALKGSENTAVIANLAYLTPFLSVVVSAIFLKEKLQPRAMIALIFIVGGILLQSLMEHRRNLTR